MNNFVSYVGFSINMNLSNLFFPPTSNRSRRKDVKSWKVLKQFYLRKQTYIYNYVFNSNRKKRQDDNNGPSHWEIQDEIKLGQQQRN